MNIEKLARHLKEFTLDEIDMIGAENFPITFMRGVKNIETESSLLTDLENVCEKLNLESLDLLLKYKLVDVDLVDDLIESNKLKIDNVESILKNYRD